MTTESPRPIPGARRTARIAAAAGLVAALVTAGAAPAFATTGGDGPTSAPSVKTAPAKTAEDKLGKADEQRLAEAQAKGEKSVTVMVATAPGATSDVTEQLHAVAGATVGKRDDKLGYVRATLPTAKAEAALKAAAKLPSVDGIDLKQDIQLDDPTPSGDTTKSAKQLRTSSSYPAPDKNTPAKNPYNPNFETGAVDFVKQHPKADGRGVTIGILDSGVDLGHPALQKTTTGERKIVDWVTSTDPVQDNDGTWLRANTAVSGPTFTAGGRTWKAPEGSYDFSTFAEKVTKGGDAAGDLNRDGDTTDTWGVLYDPVAGTVRVDLNNNNDFSDDAPMKPYKDGYQVGYFGTDNPATDVVERVPFTVEIRKNVVYDAAGHTSDYVNIGVIESEHGTHVAGITSANGLFGGKMSGAAPGAKIVSSRACNWDGGCTNIALTEGMIDLVTNRHVDIVNMSIGGLPALNDGNNARAALYKRLIDTYGVQLVISAGNDGPGVNTIGDPGLADHVISVGASISKETWAANYGSGVSTDYQMMPFSSRGPREDGGFTPTLSAPGAAINSTQTWLPGSQVKEAGYSLPAGYSMLQGTSMASPQAAGASALLISAAKQQGIDLPPADLRTALTSTAKHIKGTQSYAEGAGLINIVGAWDAIKETAKKHAPAHEYTVTAPVSSALGSALKTPNVGTGIYDRESGLKAGQKTTYDVTVTRTTGPDKNVKHKLSLKNDDGTFKVLGDKEVSLPLGKPVTVKVQAQPKSAGVHSAILQVDDPKTVGVDQQIMATVIVATPIAGPGYTFSASSTIQRNSTKSYFVTVPAGAQNLEVRMSALRSGSQTRFISIHPYGVAVDPTGTPNCYPNYDNPANTCRPDLRSYAKPQAGVWEIEVEARRTSPYLDNSFKLDASVLGVTFDPATQTVPEAKIGTPAPVQWKVTNNFAGIEGRLQGGSLGSAKVATGTIKAGETQTSTVTIGAGVEHLDVSIGNTSDAGADLDLYVFDASGKAVAQSTTSSANESVSLVKPAAGTYTIQVAGYAVPAGSTTYAYKDVYFAPSLGTVKVDADKTVKLAAGASAQVAADVVVAGAAPEGRQFFGTVQLVNERGTAAGSGSVLIGKVTQ
ncbi:serine protease [Streptomyces sp. CB01201]|uniref:S8 family serine peptidase n=1 Tax=Streptomyces sp. CB01201 TaxID=2020324 RepID=UPI000C27B4FB|nr:S8 family serine peptidase [Streptomyces sp. CB01201]PJM98229.1 serine protease [Streptomyces sp. CB01201]